VLALVDMPAEQQGLLVKAITHNGKKAVVVSGTQEQVRKALEVIAMSDVPGNAAGKVR
jgi:malonyl CoA-acyl carrier protein transacylase